MSAEGLNDAEASVLAQAGISREDLYNSGRYIQSVRTGLSGSVVRALIEALRIPRVVVSGILKVDLERACEWLQTPVPARCYEVIDTFERRKWIDQVLTQIEYGEFM